MAGLGVRIPTPDGLCDAFFVAPPQGPHPAVLIWPDIFGLRPAFDDLARRLAAQGHAVLVVNPFYRVRPAPTAPLGAATPFPEVKPLKDGLTTAMLDNDARALLAWLAGRPEVAPGSRMGVVGYCMGGSMAVRAGAAEPERVGAVASFHGGQLVTPADDSPHRLIARTPARFLFAVAADDDQREPEAKLALRQALDAAQRAGEVEVYPAGHGWCPPDARAHDPVQAERAWQRLLVLLRGALH